MSLMKLLNRGRTVILGLLIAGFIASGAQRATAYRPLDGREFSELLETYLGRSERLVSGREVFALTVRILPPFSPERELRIVSPSHGAAIATVKTLSRPLQQSVNEYLARGGVREMSAEFRRSISVSIEYSEITSQEMGAWLDALRNAIGRTPQMLAMQNREPDTVRVSLDPTIYELSYDTGETHLVITSAGPDPTSQYAAAGLSPIIRWILDTYGNVKSKAKQRQSK